VLVDSARERLEIADDAGRGLRVRKEDRLGAAELLQTGGNVLCGRNLAPRVFECLHLRAIGRRDRAPTLAEVAGGDDEHPLARRAEVRDRGLHRTCSGRGEEQHVAFGQEDFSQARERALVDRLEVGPAMVDDRLRDRCQHLRWHGRRPGRQQVALLAHLG
jgi:hypothetical protein